MVNIGSRDTDQPEEIMRRTNLALAEQLASAGWRPPHLVNAVNSLLGEGYLSRSTVSEWIHAGRIPREPLPAIVAQLLTEATGQPVSVKDLWPGVPLAPAWAVPADEGLTRIATSPRPAIALANDWVHHADHRTGRDRRRFIPVPPASLPTVDRSAPTALRASDDPWYSTTRETTHQVNRLPATHATLRFTHRHLLALAETLLNLPHEPGLADALALTTAAAGQLAQSLHEQGLAQRYAASSAIFLKQGSVPGRTA